jgi:hypothetical protein
MKKLPATQVAGIFIGRFVRGDRFDRLWRQRPVS